ncbi:MAG TPA: bifunctional nuclease family protein [Armatimonadota bacterium]|nr:bifunctional nuclease family protein [Armatimonadota bacterium]
MLVEMVVHAIAVDQGEQYIIVLRDATHTRALPIVVGAVEARAIDNELRRRRPPRPQTHDLLRDIVMSIEAQVRAVIITELRDQTYYALVEIERHGETYQIDSRPSDAIALALRCRAPIYVSQDVVEDTTAAAEEAARSAGSSPEIDERFQQIIADAGLNDAE